MSRTESPDEVRSSGPRISSESAAMLGKWGAQLAGYGVATIAITFMLLRPRRSGSGNRGSLFLGSGIIVVLVKTLLSVSDGTDASPVPAASALAAATPAPVASPVPAPPGDIHRAPVARKRPINTAVVTPPKPSPAEAKPKKPAPAPRATEPAKAKPSKRASAPKIVAANQRSAPLGPRYADKVNGYSVQFPAGWTCKPSSESGWLLDATDGQTAFISVGFPKFPANVTLDQVPVERVTRGIQKRAGTAVHANGYGTVSGRRCLWHKFTGPIARGGAATKMTAVHYFLPLQDGRALELRLAAAPEKFNEVAPKMKQSVDTFKLLTKLADARVQ